MPDNNLMKTQDVCDALNASRQTVHRWIKEGKLHPIASPGRNLRFRRSDIEALLQPRIPA